MTPTQRILQSSTYLEDVDGLIESAIHEWMTAFSTVPDALVQEDIDANQFNPEGNQPLREFMDTLDRHTAVIAQGMKALAAFREFMASVETLEAMIFFNDEDADVDAVIMRDAMAEAVAEGRA